MDDRIPYPLWKFEGFPVGVHCRPRHHGRVSVLVIVPAYFVVHPTHPRNHTIRFYSD